MCGSIVVFPGNYSLITPFEAPLTPSSFVLPASWALLCLTKKKSPPLILTPPHRAAPQQIILYCCRRSSGHSFLREQKWGRTARLLPGPLKSRRLKRSALLMEVEENLARGKKKTRMLLPSGSRVFLWTIPWKLQAEQRKLGCRRLRHLGRYKFGYTHTQGIFEPGKKCQNSVKRRPVMRD